jgi:hypothetical protein
MGILQNDMQPEPCQLRQDAVAGGAAAARVVALQVEFERQILKPAFHLIGSRLWV